MDKKLIETITEELVFIISETNGLTLNDTLELMAQSPNIRANKPVDQAVREFRTLLSLYERKEVMISQLLIHPLSQALFLFFKNFPIPFHEEHIHLTGSLSAEFLYPRLLKLSQGPNADIYQKKIEEIYGKGHWPPRSVEHVDSLIKLKDEEFFKDYLRILYLPKLILTDKSAHAEASYHMAFELFNKYNVGKIRLKFTLSRATSDSSEQIPGLESLSEEDVVIGLYEGLMKFKKEQPLFSFILSPSFRKESSFFDSQKFQNKKEHFGHQVQALLAIIEKYPELKNVLTEVDTVGDERDLFRKVHFEEMRSGLRKLQYYGLGIRSHHGETWYTLKRGIQSVDNAMNIWHIDTLEHGLALGINPNYYFHALFQRVMERNCAGQSIRKGTQDYAELEEMEWKNKDVFWKLVNGETISPLEETIFIKAKFNTAREVEHYQHDVLNRMINKRVSLVSLPSSNMKLTGNFPDFKGHPFSWWEKKGVRLGVGTDNYITLGTNYIQELLILLYCDAGNLKITKLLMVATRENRRPYLAHLLWEMRKKLVNI